MEDIEPRNDKKPWGHGTGWRKRPNNSVQRNNKNERRNNDKVKRQNWLMSHVIPRLWEGFILIIYPLWWRKNERELDWERYVLLIQMVIAAWEFRRQIWSVSFWGQCFPVMRIWGREISGQDLWDVGSNFVLWWDWISMWTGWRPKKVCFLWLWWDLALT